ncbi:MAG TPA: hypothetical protein VFN30_03280 [Chitinophagaceae bacterium]|nr:hypothetical protein [Chitinophagaceae bacterium]
MKKTLYIIFVIAIFTITYSCSKSKDNSTTGGGSGGSTPVNCTNISAKFSADVQPIISTYCAITGCHNGTQQPTLTTYAQIAGNATLINSQVQSGRMPKVGSLTTDQKNIIACWVQSGALNN